MSRRALPWIVAAAVLVLDRLTKLAVTRCIRPGDAFIVFDGFSITHVHNSGIAFSMLASGGPAVQWALVAVIVVTIAVIAWIVVRSGATLSGLAAVALGAILGGAVGNLLDRLLYGSVIDFLHFWIRIGGHAYTWPDFNVADSAITVGAGLLILSEILSARRGGPEEEA